jgi:hypothetical protein
MSQHDLDIANQGFPATRADLNNALKALGSSNSGATAPSTTYANQLWYDTANNIIKIRNEDNDAWISLFTLDQTNDNIEGLTMNGNLDLADAARMRLGNSQDLQIYHDALNSYIADNSGTGNLTMSTNQLNVLNAAQNENMAQFNENGAVTLYFDNSPKIATSGTGCTVTGTLAATDISLSAQTMPTVTVFVSGSGTFTTPTGAAYLRVRCVGGGGGGGGSGSAGSPANGASGGTTSFGSFVAGGASGGPNSLTGGFTGGAGGSASGGHTNVVGGRGHSNMGNTSPALFANYGVNGADGPFGGGGPGGANGAGAVGGNAQGFGGGGGGVGGNASVYGSAGGGAGGYVEGIITSLASTYSYAVGAGGTGGTGGTGGGNGGNGNAGVIIVEVFYYG